MNLDSILSDLTTRQKMRSFAYNATNAFAFGAKSYASPVKHEAYRSYNRPDQSYVHVPSWVRQERASMREFGPSLFGLANTYSGLVRIREDLVGNQFTEVLLHEVLHQLYPNESEQGIRKMVLSRLGSAATIHSSI